MRAVDAILKKRDGLKLTKKEIGFFVRGAVKGDIPEYQTAAFLMAVYFQGMAWEEIVALTEAFVDSGDRLKIPGLNKPTVDKHSTGGVGDKVSFIVHCLAAANGCAVPSMSGRGLGHTGGTLDKLEAIPGAQTRFTSDRIADIVKKAGVCIFGQTDRMVPADRLWYSLRDVTGTVPSLPLIVASIMSKKIAEGSDALLLDVKCGPGALMKDMEKATALAEALVKVGVGAGLKTRALITDMSEPLGYAVGNAVEIEESIKILRGENPGRLEDLCVETAAHMIELAGKAGSLNQARAKAKKAIADGKGLEVFRKMVKAQGGDVSCVDDPKKLPQPKFRKEVQAAKTGVLQRVHTEEVGWISVALGAGRAKAEDRVNPAVGILVLKKVGDAIKKGEPFAVVLADDKGKIAEAESRLKKAFVIGDGKVTPGESILKVVQEAG